LPLSIGLALSLASLKRFCLSDYRYPFYQKEGGGYSTPEMDADWEKGIFPMGQVPVLQANGHRFAQVRFLFQLTPSWNCIYDG
jgi:hypothetical protein